MLTYPQTSSNADIITIRKKVKIKIKARGIVIRHCSAARICSKNRKRLPGDGSRKIRQEKRICGEKKSREVKGIKGEE
jgi:hypothetical protein